MNSKVQKEVKKLIQHILQNEENLDKINAKEKQIIFQLKKDTMSFVNRKEMDILVQKMAEKFQFHGFFPQADHLQKIYNKFMNKTPKQDHTTAMNIVRFLLYMSDSPTDKFLEHPELFMIENEEEEDAINWGEYLLEGIEVYEPDYFEDSSVDSDEFESADEGEVELLLKDRVIAPVESSSNIALKMDFNSNHEELMSTIQHTWYNKEYYLETPNSKKEEANIGILWEVFLNSQTHGLIDLEKTSFISEYKVAREIVWQFFGTHNSFLFYFKGNKLKIRNNVSISSVRNVSLAAFVEHFLEYIELMEFFRDFLDSFKYIEPCQTYICYAMGIKRNLLDPIYAKLIDIEESIRRQEETLTLLKLSESLIPIFAPLKALREIHQEITVSTQENSALYCSTSLLCNLRSSLKNSITKLEHDLKLTLYMESLYKYFFLIDSWLTRNDFVDLDGEFVLVQVTSTQSLEYKTSPFLSAKVNYEVSRDIKDEFRNDGIIQIICTKVLQIAKNIRLLFLLRKFDFYTKYEGTLHQELIRRFLSELCKYFKYENEDVFENLIDFPETEEPKALVIKHPVISSDKCKKPINMDKLENLVDTNDSFLMEAFAEFIYEQKTFNETKPCDITLFDRISKITTGLFPLRNCLERIFRDILKERFSVSGLMVKGALIEDHHLDKIFEFLRALYLFCDASIFPFFQQFFVEMKFLHHSPWRYMKLSSHLKDIISETFPAVCDKCDISLNSTKEQCVDALDICDSLNINVVMKWPLNIVITEEEMKVYKSLFHFMVKLKWAFHTVNSLSCKVISTNTKSSVKLIKNTVKKLEVFKFSLLQCLNFVQHYVICFCFMKCLKQFELDFEKSNDLDSVIKSHCDFVEGIELMVGFLESEKDAYNFKSVLYCVKVLNSVWYDLDLAMDEQVLDATYNLFRKCKVNIETQVNKIYLINY